MPPPAIAPLASFNADALRVKVFDTQSAMATAAAELAAQCLRDALTRAGRAAAIIASAASQIQFIDQLVARADIDWSRVTLFHMDEYLGVPDTHPASFRKFLRERVEQRVHPQAFHYVAGESLEPLVECRRYAGLLAAQPIDLCCLGIGENGHIAFNDPAVARFDDPDPVKLVCLDEACRQQQVGEGAFPNLAAVPTYAYTLTIPALSGARTIVGVVPEARKARAVRDALEGPLATACPASFLRTRAQATLFLDRESASLLAPNPAGRSA